MFCKQQHQEEQHEGSGGEAERVQDQDFTFSRDDMTKSLVGRLADR